MAEAGLGRHFLLLYFNLDLAPKFTFLSKPKLKSPRSNLHKVNLLDTLSSDG